MTVAAGTDAGNIGTLHGPAIHREFELMAEAGLTPREILVNATKNAAHVFAAEPEMGTIEKGKFADLLVLDADPLVDVANLQRIHRVVKGGMALDPAQILPPSPETVVRRQVEAYNAGDIETDYTTARNTHDADLGTNWIGSNTASSFHRRPMVRNSSRSRAVSPAK